MAPTATGPRRRPPAKEERVKPGATEKRAPRKPAVAGDGRATALTKELRGELKKKLEKAKKAKGRAVGDGEEVEEPDGAGDESPDGSIEEVPARETGTVLAGAEALRTRRGKDVLATTADARQGTKGSSTKSLSGQLMAQAMAVASHRKKVKAKNKKPKRDKRKQVVDALVKILTPSSSTAAEKKKKKKKKGRRKRKTLADGTIVSCSSDFSSSAEEESADKASSESDLEASEKEKQGSPWIGPSPPDEPCQGATGARFLDGASRRREHGDRGHQSGNLLCTAEGASRDALPGGDPGPPARRRHRQSGRGRFLAPKRKSLALKRFFLSLVNRFSHDKLTS